jgi:hypothetical protein
VKAVALFSEKRLLLNRKTGDAAVAELKVWQVPVSRDYPEGRKFSLFLVVSGRTVIGIDNHKPKGPHFHLGDQELPYLYRGVEKLLADFWEMSMKAGYEP